MPPLVSEEYKEKKKKKILMSALECLAQKGFELCTLDDIAAHSRISKGAIYSYFSSKDEIYLELLNDATSNNIEDINKNFTILRSPISKISFLFDVYLNSDPFNSTRLGHTVVFYEYAFHCTRNEKLLNLLTERRNYLINLIVFVLKEGQKSGEINQNIDPELFAHKFWTIIDGVCLQSIYKNYPFYDVLREFKDLYIDELKN